MNPVIYIKVKPYLKEYLMNLEDSQGDKIYPKEPIRFGSKTRLRLLLDRFRRVPGPRNKMVVPTTAEERKHYLAVEIPVDHSVKGDVCRTFLSTDSQSHISKLLYDEFLVAAVEYVKLHFEWQRQTFPRCEPILSQAYRAFFDDYGIESMDEEALRKALFRRRELLPDISAKKIFERKRNIYPFKSNLLAKKDRQVGNL